MAITLSSEIKSIIKTAGKKLRLKSERSLALSRFTELIQWHSMVKQLSIENNFTKKNQNYESSILFSQANHWFYQILSNVISVGFPFFNNMHLWHTVDGSNGNSLVFTEWNKHWRKFSNNQKNLIFFRYIMKIAQQSLFWYSPKHFMHLAYYLLSVNYVTAKHKVLTKLTTCWTSIIISYFPLNYNG